MQKKYFILSLVMGSLLSFNSWALKNSGGGLNLTVGEQTFANWSEYYDPASSELWVATYRDNLSPKAERKCSYAPSFRNQQVEYSSGESSGCGDDEHKKDGKPGPANITKIVLSPKANSGAPRLEVNFNGGTTKFAYERADCSGTIAILRVGGGYTINPSKTKLEGCTIKQF